jgi:ACS family hexuronate transporter-like MFS transporter
MDLPRRTGWAIAVVATLAMTVSYVDRQALSHLAPTVRDALDISPSEYGNLTGAFSLSYLVGAPLAGWLLDRIGARRGLVLSILVWSVVSALHALVPSFGVLFGLRVALGAAESPSFPGAAQTVRRALPVNDRSMGYGLIFTGSSIGAMIAAPLAIGLNAHFGWRLAFVGTSLCGLAWLPLWIYATGGRRRAALEAAEAEEKASPRAPSVPWRTVLSDPAVQRAIALVFVSAPIMLFVLNWYAQVLVDVFHLTQNDLAYYLWLPPLLFDVGAVGFGALAARRDRASPTRSHVELVWVAALLTVSLALVPLSRSPSLAVLLAAIALLGGGALYTVATADMLRRVRPEVTGRAGGCTAASQSAAHIVFAPLIGAILQRTHTYTHVLVGLGLIALPGVVVWSVWPMHRRAD